MTKVWAKASSREAGAAATGAQRGPVPRLRPLPGHRTLAGSRDRLACPLQPEAASAGRAFSGRPWMHRRGPRAPRAARTRCVGSPPSSACVTAAGVRARAPSCTRRCRAPPSGDTPCCLPGPLLRDTVGAPLSVTTDLRGCLSATGRGCLTRGLARHAACCCRSSMGARPLGHVWSAAAFTQRGPLSSHSRDHAAAQGVTGKSCRLLSRGEKLWPPPDSNTGPFCNGHTWVASFNMSGSVLRVTDDLNYPFDLRKVQSRLSQAAGRGARWTGHGSEGLARLRHRPTSRGPRHTASSVHSWCCPARRGSQRGPRDRAQSSLNPPCILKMAFLQDWVRLMHFGDKGRARP